MSSDTIMAVVEAPQSVHDSAGRDSGCRRGYIEGEPVSLLDLLGQMLRGGWNILAITTEKDEARQWLGAGCTGGIAVN